MSKRLLKAVKFHAVFKEIFGIITFGKCNKTEGNPS